MRSLIIALALAAPVSAVAASPISAPAPTYSNPMTTVHQQKEQVVFLTFVNYTPQDREVRIGDKQYKMQNATVLHVYAPVGSPVFVFSEQNTKVNGQELMRVSATDSGKSVILK